MSQEIKLPLTVLDIQQILPHRYPFLMIDRVSELEDGVRILGHKNVSANEPYFQGHFPDRPVMPGVMILEAMAQLGALFAKLSTNGASKEALMVFAGVESIRFRRQVFPGDRLDIEMKNSKQKLRSWRMEGTVLVDGKKAADGIILAAEVAW